MQKNIPTQKVRNLVVCKRSALAIYLNAGFVCSLELIEELKIPTDLKFGRGMGNTVFRNIF